MTKQIGAIAFVSKVCWALTLAAAACCGTLVLTDSACATTAAGRTNGSFSVSPSGGGTYTIPIWAPPGPNSIQPSIQLAYSSQTGSGLAGVGWNLSGLSSISRCNATFAQDAAPAPIALAISDGYCLDGQRLRLTSGTYGTAGSTYQTEIANFTTVMAYGTAGNGPAYFIAVDRNGRTYTYGNGGNSQVLASGSSTVISWQLNEVNDPAANAMTISYNTATGSSVPATISWTPSSHGASTYNYTMTFGYGATAAPSSLHAYIAGTAVTNTNLLTTITIAYSGTTVKVYSLGYVTSPTTGRDELQTVKECADSALSNCLLPTTFTYQAGAIGVSTTTQTAVPSGSQVFLNVNYDFNGDGYTDLAYCNGGSPSYVYVAFGSASGYGTPKNTGLTCGALYGDLQGSGTDGILAPNGSTWYYYTWNGTTFAGVSTGLAYDSTAAQYVLADLNGDGLPDLISGYLTTSSGPTGTKYQYSYYTRLNTTAAGASPTFASTTTLAYQTTASTTLHSAQIQSTQQYGPGRYFDFNGDGRNDLSLQIITGTSPNFTVTTYELLSTGTTFTATAISSLSGSNYVPVYFLDFNSDSCTDYLTGGVIYISGCNGSVPATVSLGSANVIGTMDWNGDGKTDVVVQNGATIGVYESNGTGLGSLISTSIPYSSNNLYFSFDANGDGLDDLGVWNNGNTTGSSTSVTYYPHAGAASPADLLASATDGYGNTVTPTYVSLVQNNYTETGYGTPPAGYSLFLAPQYVVSEAVFSDPSSASGATYNQTFWYYDAWTNLQGRGWQSFYGMRVMDSRNSLTSFHYYERTFPYTGMDFSDTVSGSSGTISGIVRTLAPLVTLSSTQYQQRYFAYFNNVTTNSYEVGGTESGDLITTSSTNYTLDNYGNATSIATTLTDSDPSSPYTGQTWTTTVTNTPDESTSPWCLSLLSQSQTTYTASNGSTAVTKTMSFTPDLTNCRYTQTVTQPGTSYSVTQSLGYDSFGNVNSQTVTGYGMTGRLTTTNWGTTGQFKMSVTDPTNATTQYNYNFSYGAPSSMTDPNNLTTSWQYTDGFGRKTKETRPDGTYTVWTYQNCSGTTGCLVGSNGLVLGHTVYNTDASVQSSGTDYLDPVDRKLVSNQTNLSGLLRTELRYDSLGRVSQTAFPCVWSALATTCTTWSTNGYDVVNRLTQTQRPISSTNSTLQTTTYAYAGRMETVTDPQSNARIFVKDVNGWLRQTKDPYGYVVTTAFDAAGNQTAVTDSLGNSLWSGTYNYGAAAFPKTTVDMDMGSWSYTYDALGEMTAWTDAKSQSFGESYDALSRPLSRSEPDLFTQWTYGSSASSHNVGKLQSVCTGLGSSPTNCTSSPGYSESETYDSFGRKSTRGITIPGQGTFTYTWAYNTTTGLLSTLTYPVSTSSYALELQYGYSNGILQTVTDISDTPNVTVWKANTMNPAGQVTQETLGNGIVTTRSYDSVTGWLGAAQSGVGGGSAVKNLSFLFDEMGNVTQRQDNNLGLTENVYYDNDYRFSYSKLNGTQNLSVGYDATGNITSKSDVVGGATWTYDPVHKHEVISLGDSNHLYSYDANGNAGTRPSATLTWTSYNFPTSIAWNNGTNAETVGFAYGPDRLRWQQTYVTSGTNETTDYIGGLVDLVINGSTQDYRHYVYAGSTPIAVYSRKSAGTNAFTYILTDHQSSVTALTNSTGGVVVSESYAPFGTRRNAATWSGSAPSGDLTTTEGITRQGYTFQTQLGIYMGLNHMNGRVQDAFAGRFLSGDSTIPDAANAESYNRYSYVNNNPVTLRDPTGFTPCSFHCKPVDGITTSKRCKRCQIMDPGDLGKQEISMTLASISTETWQGAYGNVTLGPPRLLGMGTTPADYIMPGVTATPMTCESGDGGTCDDGCDSEICWSVSGTALTDYILAPLGGGPSWVNPPPIVLNPNPPSNCRRVVFCD